MSSRVEWVPYGRGAADALRRTIAAIKGDEPLAPVTVVVPSNHVGVATRRLLASGELGPTCGRGVGLVAVTFVTPYRLAELLGAPALAAAGRRPVSTPVIAAALRAALSERPGLFAPVATHPATEAALVASYRELREVSVVGLDAIAATSPRADDVVRLHRATRARLEPAWYDEQDLMLSAASVFASENGAARNVGALVIYLPQRVSPHGQVLFDAAARSSDVVVLAGCTGDPRADADVVAATSRLSAMAGAPPTHDPHTMTTAERTRIVLASDSDDEVRVAVRAVIEAVRAGTSLDRIAILHASPEPYARLAHEHLAAAGIKTNGPAVVPLAGRVAGRLLLEMLALADRGFRRQDVFSWLTTAPVLREGRWVPVVAWERLSRDAGIVAGRHDWDTRLARHADDLEARAAVARADPEQAWRADRDADQARRARELGEFVLSLIDDLTAAASEPRQWSEHADWARRHLRRFVGGAGRRNAWPDQEAKAVERVELALDRLAALDPVESNVALDVFTRTLALELEDDLGRVGRFGDGVLVAPISMGIGLDLDLVVVLGLVEGSFPAPVRDDSLLPDHEREAAHDQLLLRRARVDREHRELLATLAGAGRHFLGVPRGDLRRSTERVPSRWVLEIATSLAGERWWTDKLLQADVEWVEHVASFDAGLRRQSFPATEQEHSLRNLLVAAPVNAADLAAKSHDRLIVGGAGMVAGRRGSTFTRFDGNLEGLAVPSPIDTSTTATRLERWSACPFAYFVQDVLRIAAVENPEDSVQMRPLDKGNLVHQALEEFIVSVLARPAADQPSPDEGWTSDDHGHLRAIGERLCDNFEAQGLTGRPIFWRRDRRRILADLDRFLDEDDTLRRLRRTRPIAAELSFGLPHGSTGAVPLTLADGRVLLFRGKADRVDRSDDGTLHVLDYKTGKANGYKKLTPDDPDQNGLHLQLAVYGAAARQHAKDPFADVLAEYWFVSAGGNFVHPGYRITADVLAKVGTTLGTIVSGIERGVFASHPTVVSSSPFVECDACDPDALGVIELRRAWDRKRADPALSPYADLAEPLAGAEIEDDSDHD